MNNSMRVVLWSLAAMVAGLALCGDGAALREAAGAGQPKTQPAAPSVVKAEPVKPKATIPVPEKPALESKPAAAAAPATPASPYRPLAPGAMRTVDPMREIAETVSRHDVVELLAVDPKLDYAKEVFFRREIWVLQFHFKPMRMIDVDLPQPSGKMQRKQIWYLVYSVTNPGKTMRPVRNEDGSFRVDHVDKPIRFVPAFLLHSIQHNKWYPDRVIPAAIGPIRTREDPHRTFYNSVEMVRDIQVGETVWGIATWEDIDPRTDRFAVYVNGLTNAYRWTDDPAKFKPGAPVETWRRLERKTLKLNFWRPGDEYEPREREIRYGAPGELDYEWVYR